MSEEDIELLESIERTNHIPYYDYMKKGEHLTLGNRSWLITKVLPSVKSYRKTNEGYLEGHNFNHFTLVAPLAGIDYETRVACTDQIVSCVTLCGKVNDVRAIGNE